MQHGTGSLRKIVLQSTRQREFNWPHAISKIRGYRSHHMVETVVFSGVVTGDVLFEVGSLAGDGNANWSLF